MNIFLRTNKTLLSREPPPCDPAAENIYIYIYTYIIHACVCIYIYIYTTTTTTTTNNSHSDTNKAALQSLICWTESLASRVVFSPESLEECFFTDTGTPNPGFQGV